MIFNISMNKKGVFVLFILFLFSLNLKAKILPNILLIPDNTNACVVIKEQQKLLVVTMKNGIPQVIDKEPCITGKKSGDKMEKGDKKTPNGVYFTVCRLTKLPEIYGVGAMPFNYPNLLDKKVLGKTGNGIWFHATNLDNRSQFSTNGCVVVTNKIFKKISKIIHVKETPIIITDNLKYEKDIDYFKEKSSLLKFIFDWTEKWENTANKQLSPYFNLYSENFVWRKGDKSSWIKHKKRVSASKKWINVSIHNLKLLRDSKMLKWGYLYVAAFDLIYRSNNYRYSGKKILYIIREQNQWKILGEENL